MSMDQNTIYEVTESAVVQSLTENEVVRKYLNKLNTPLSEKPVSLNELLSNISSDSRSPEDMGIIRSYVASHPEFGNAEIVATHSFEQGGHCLVLSNGDDKYVAFDGSDGDAEWKDNGEGLYKAYTNQQVKAKEYFDSLVKDSIISADDNVTVTGHSKGGNKAMFVTMEDQAGIVDKCIALDGQGFSPEAIDRWHAMHGNTGYADRTSKITLIAGENDYVHCLGMTIAGTQYTVKYNPWVDVGKDPNDIGSGLASWHSHEHLFTPVWDEKLGMYNFVLNPETKPGTIDAVLRDFMKSFMLLPPSLRQKGADPIMNIFRKGTKNNWKDYLNLITALMAAGLSRAGFDALINLVALFNPGLVKIVKAAISKKLKDYTAPSTKVEAGNKSGSSSVVSGSSHGGSTASRGGSVQTIVLNQEALRDLSNRMDAVFAEAEEASKMAYDAESIVCGIGCNAINAIPALLAQDIKVIIDRIIESFTSVDAEKRKEAEDIIGPGIYTAISNGANVTCNSDGTIIVQSSIENYQGLKQHLSDNCTNTSLAMLIQRYYLLHNGNCDLVYDDINKNDFYWSVENYGLYKSAGLPNGQTYSCSGGETSDLVSVGGGNAQAGLAAQLNAHPEGVILYGRYANNTGSHAILISEYQINPDGSYTFTAIDPATGNTTPLDQSTLYSNSRRGTYNSVDDLLNNLFFYQYIDNIQ